MSKLASGGAPSRQRRQARRAAEKAAAVAPITASVTTLSVVRNDDGTETTTETTETTAPVVALSPERQALAAVQRFAKPMPCANCDHAYSDHLGTKGPCTYDMGDDETCGCQGYKTADEMSAARNAKISAAVDAALGAGAETLTFSLMDFEVVETLPLPNPSPDAPAVPTLGGKLSWSAVLCPEGALTDDGRVFAPGSISWRELPLTLMAMIETAEGHDGAIVAGRIDRIWRDEASSRVMAAGEFDDGEFGLEIARMVADETLRGVSVDIAVHGYERGAQSDYFDEDGNWRPQAAAAAADDGPSLLDVLFGEGDDLIFVVTDGVIGAATVCPFPAFAQATISLEASLVAAHAGNPAIWTLTTQSGMTIVETPKIGEALPAGETRTAVAGDVVTASAAGLVPVAPPAEWFSNPDFDELTPLMVDDAGRIFGHAWQWDFCHTGIPDVCTTAPYSHADYAYFHLGEIVCDDGGRVTVGKITIDTPHAAHGLGRADATAHYDNTGTVAGHVVCGEDEFGGWIAGALHPDLDEATVRLLRGAVLSGDWRNVNGNLELVALLAVNVPGFPVPRVKARVEVNDDGAEVYTLVAAGVHAGVSDEQRLAKIAALGDTVRQARVLDAFAKLRDRAAAIAEQG